MRRVIDISEDAYELLLEKGTCGKFANLGEIVANSTPLEQEPRWIPVSERMPEEDTDVLVTLKCGLIGIMQKKLADDDYGEPCYIWQDFEGEEHEVIAWMPLPEPYKADRSEEDGK